LSDDAQQSVFMTWLDEHGPSVMKVARAYTLTDEDRQDLAQEILLQAWQSLATYEKRAPASTWFYRVALNTAMNWKRKDQPRRQKQVFLEVHAVADGEQESREQVEQRETLEQLFQAIHRLPKADAALVLLSLEGLGYRDIADVQGLSESNVGVKLNRVKKTLSELMKERSNVH